MRLVSLCAVLSTLLMLGSPGHAADGDLDPAFGTAGKVVTTIAPFGDAADVALQGDGKIVVIGTLRASDPSVPPAMVVLRYLSSGALDTSFASVGYVTAQVDIFGGSGRAVAVQPDGRILALGQTGQITHGSSAMFVVRYDPDGTPDATFGAGGMVQFPSLVLNAGDVALGPGGTILVAELSAGAAFNTFTRVWRLQAGGAMDSTFGSAGSVVVPLVNFGVAPEMALRADGKIVVASAQIVQVTPAILTAFGAARLLPAGTVDTTFGTGGASPAFGDAQYIAGSASGVALQADERLVLAGAAAGGFALLGMGANGGLDASFGSGGLFTDGFAPGANAIVAVDGGFVAAGGGGAEFALVRVSTSGTLDPSFGSGGKVMTSFDESFSSVAALTVQPDGSIVAAGTIGSSSASSIALARYLVCPDSDGDELCDAIDECPDGASFTSARLVATDLATVGCDDRFTLNGTFTPPPSPPIDPMTAGLRVVVRNAAGDALVDETVPAGAYDNGTRAGWRVYTTGTSMTWKFVRPAGGGAVRRAVVKKRARTGDALKIGVKGSAVCFAAPSSLPLSATVVLTPPRALTGQCGEVHFAGAACASRAGGQRIVCH